MAEFLCFCCVHGEQDGWEPCPSCEGRGFHEDPDEGHRWGCSTCAGCGAVRCKTCGGSCRLTEEQFAGYAEGRDADELEELRLERDPALTLAELGFEEVG